MPTFPRLPPPHHPPSEGHSFLPSPALCLLEVKHLPMCLVPLPCLSPAPL